MIQHNIAVLKKNLHEVLYLELDEFGLEAHQEEVISKLIGFHLRSDFQPIRNAEKFGEAIGYEALLRPMLGTDAVSPLFAFAVADNLGKLVKLDRVARTLHMLNYLNLDDNQGYLFLNVHPKLLVSVNAHGKVFERILHLNSVPTQKVVIEIMENAVDAVKLLKDAIDNYRDCGYKIAIDDFGSKDSNFDRLWKLSPDFVKLDLSIIKQAQTDSRMRRVLPKLIEIPQALGAQVIIEGIENEIQCKIALDAGATLLQGNFLGQPALADYWNKQKLPQYCYETLPGTINHFGGVNNVVSAHS